ncbi:MAG: DNA mismatch repair endonuclease MutL [Candidatus Dojkabacteria bacterium]
MGKIQKLPQATINKIAAGEVVERPASIVKELIENAIDADSTKIEIKIENGGIDLIQLSDNGSGIAKEDLPRAIELHATSKLTSIEQLQAIGTLGFRGEALASINAAADVEILSSTGKQAYLLKNDGSVIPASRTKGTTITVKNLFRKIPARRSFLKSAGTEEKRIKLVIHQFEILRPDIEFSLEADSKVKITNSTKITKEDLIELDHKNEQVRILGEVSHPRVASKSATQYFYVNNRAIYSRTLAAAVKKAYGNKLPPELQPHAFIRVELPGDTVDVNVHPRKEEVKFSDESKIFREVFHAVDDALSKAMRSEFEHRFSMPNPAAQDKVDAPIIKQSQQHAQPINRSQSKLMLSSSYKSAALEFSKHLLQDSEVREAGISNYLQIFNTYIVFEKGESFFLIDQHAADERVKYERIRDNLNRANLEQTPLLLPEVVSISSLSESEARKLKKDLEKVGFDVEISSGKISLKKIPTVLHGKISFKDLIEELIQIDEEDFSEKHKGNTAELKLDRLIATTACHASIRAGEKMQPEKVRKLIEDLWKCKDPYTCPHGRPIIVEFSRGELEHKFMRTK